MTQGNTAYRDRLFSFIFGSEEHKDWTLSLYNAVNHTHYTDLTAIDRTIELMPDDFQTKPYLDAHKAEVKNMLLTEYNEAETMELFKAEGRREGREEGRREGRREGREEGRREGRGEGQAEGREDERLDNIRSLIRSLKLSAQQAMDALGIPRSEQARYAEKL